MKEKSVIKILNENEGKAFKFLPKEVQQWAQNNLSFLGLMNEQGYFNIIEDSEYKIKPNDIIILTDEESMLNIKLNKEIENGLICPNEGCEPQYLECKPHVSSDGKYFYIRCTNCGMHSPKFHDFEDVVKWWKRYQNHEFVTWKDIINYIQENELENTLFGVSLGGSLKDRYYTKLEMLYNVMWKSPTDTKIYIEEKDFY